MSRQKKPPATAWRERELPDWTVGTFRAYLSDRHKQLYGIPYVARNYGMETKLLKCLIAEHGNEITFQFISACFNDYKPTREYPGLSFAFMYSYMKGRILPKILAEIKREEELTARRESRQQQSADVDDIMEWL